MGLIWCMRLLESLLLLLGPMYSILRSCRKDSARSRPGPWHL